MDNKKKAEIVFEEELQHIKSAAIKQFTLKCFEKLTPDYLWDFTASSSQTHHPKISNKKHGLVLHTKLCVWWGRKLAERHDEKNLDIMISALLLHDLQKFGSSLDENKKPTLAAYWETHGPILAIQMQNIYSGVSINENVSKDIKAIIACVALHMGRWTNEPLKFYWNKFAFEEHGQFYELVHLADYCASRKVDDKLEELGNWKML